MGGHIRERRFLESFRPCRASGIRRLVGLRSSLVCHTPIGRRLMRPAIQSALLRVLELVFLVWVSATGRWALRLATGGRIGLPRTGLVNDDTMPADPGVRANLHGLARWLVYDNVYFLIGLLIWIVAGMALLVLYAYLFGPLPPVHRWFRS
jgi:hypothetical protein